MGWVSGANLTAATSAAGGFGILAAVTMTPDQLRAAVEGVQERTDAPFGVNFRADQPDLADRVAYVVSKGVKLVSFAHKEEDYSRAAEVCGLQLILNQDILGDEALAKLHPGWEKYVGKPMLKIMGFRKA